MTAAVLILVVVDDGLVLGEALVENKEFAVLILVVVDDGLVLDPANVDFFDAETS